MEIKFNQTQILKLNMMKKKRKHIFIIDFIEIEFFIDCNSREKQTSV